MQQLLYQITKSVIQYAYTQTSKVTFTFHNSLQPMHSVESRHSTACRMNLSAISMVIFCSFAIKASFIGTDFFFYHLGTLHIIRTVLVVTHAVAYFLYPLLGWLSDVYFTRYKVIRLAFIIMILASLDCVLATLVVVLDISLAYDKVALITIMVVATPGVLAMLLSLGLFEANAIQFGMDQLLESSSDQLSSFIHWYYWSSYVGHFILFLLPAGIVIINSSYTRVTTTKYPIDDYMITRLIFCVVLLQLILATVGLFVLIRYKKKLNIEKPGHNPLVLIYKVVKYAWKHTFPENRSAFTYWENEIPPRIDLGKNKYGGPFTTEEVEDTKSFFRILLLLFSLLGYHLSGHGYSIVKQLMIAQCPSTWLLILIGDPMNLTTIVIFTSVPLYQLIDVRYRQRYIPSIFKRMGLGLLCCLLKVIIEIALQVTQKHYATQLCNNICPLFNCYSLATEKFNGSNFICGTINCKPENSIFLILLVVPQVLQGLSFLLVFLSSIEFICAQAPLRLKGLLIGLWYASLSVHYLLVEVPEFYIPLNDGTTWVIFQEVKAFLIALSLIFFAYVSGRYRYRVRDEVVNEQYLIEEIYEREIRIAAEMEGEADENESLTSSSASIQQYMYH